MANKRDYKVNIEYIIKQGNTHISIMCMGQKTRGSIKIGLKNTGTKEKC